MATKTKKLINDPDDVIAELIDGMVGAHPDLYRREGETGRAIVAVEGPRDGKVGIVVGGGSGHEPLFSGYVGRGLADAAAIGNVFASPSPDQIADAARSADGGAGVLFLYGNYTGDVMNFDMAAEIVKGEGIEAVSIQVRDDVASAPKDRRGERRGIAGDVFVFKIAGAAADKGYDFAEVRRVTEHADRSTASMGVALGPCSLPQTLTPNFDIGPGEMEVGMGIHGEPGIERTALETADAVAARLVDPILDDLGLGAGDRVAVMVNGLGSTSMMELYILHRRVRQILADKNIAIHASFVGNYATSMEMAGASVTMTRLDAELTALIDHPCRTLAMTIGSAPAPVPGATRTTRERRAGAAQEEARTGPLKEDGDLTPAVFRAAMGAIVKRIGAEKERLSQLDGALGDGDHGVTMDLGWRAIEKALAQADENATISALCRSMSHAFIEAVGASVGPLYATGLLRAGEAVDDRRNLDAEATVAWLAAMSRGIRDRGGATVGDKTMVDAWVPAVDAAEDALAKGGSIADCLEAAADGAKAGAASTERLEAKRGRAAKLSGRSVGHIDAGAASAAVLLAAMAESVRETLG